MKSVKIITLFFFVFYFSQLHANTVKESETAAIPHIQNITTVSGSGFQRGEPTRFEIHTIQSRNETPYFIAKQYGITVEDIYTYNPGIRRFNRGTKIKIPVWDITETSPSDQIPETEDETDVSDAESITPCQPLSVCEYLNTTFNIALFLPFFLETNYLMNRRFDSEDYASIYSERETTGDDIIEIGRDNDMFIGFQEGTENYLQFYEGVLLAVDSMQKTGMNVTLNVYDTQQNPDITRRFLYNNEFLNTDLIIGPVFANEQRDVSAFSANNQIIMVSPLSTSEFVSSNPYFYQVNPDRDYLFRHTAEMVIRDFPNSNFIVFQTGNYNNTPEAGIVDLIRESFNSQEGINKEASFTVYDFRANGIARLRTILSSDRENVIFIPSSSESELSRGIQNLNQLANEYPITLIGTNQYPTRYETIRIEYFHNLKLTYVAPYWTDYENYNTINYIEKFKRHFFTEPNNYGQQGYDVAFYFLNALKNYGRDFRHCLPEMNVDLIQGNYRFEKVSPFGGYMNQGVSVITYTRSYDVIRKRIDTL